MPTFIQNYIDKLNISSILEELFSKSVSLVLLFIVFYIVKIILHQVVKRVVKPSLKFSQKDEARQKTISRLIENILNYTLYFFLLYFVLGNLFPHQTIHNGQYTAYSFNINGLFPYCFWNCYYPAFVAYAYLCYSYDWFYSYSYYWGSRACSSNSYQYMDI